MGNNEESWGKMRKNEEKPETGSRQGKERQQGTSSRTRKPETGNRKRKWGKMWKNGEKWRKWRKLGKNDEHWGKMWKNEEKPATGSRQSNERQQGTPSRNRKPEAGSGNGEKLGKIGKMKKNGSRPKFHYFFFLWASSRRISLVFEVVVPSKMHVSSSLGHHVHATAATAAFAAAFAALLLFLLLCCCFCC